MDPILQLLDGILADIRPNDGGQTAQYIPELATAEPDLLALAIVGPRGAVLSVGDDHAEFSIQSISKPFVLALALADLGREEVFRRVGVEPSGEPFNAISLEPATGRPANPLVNAGAIATTAMLPGDGIDSRTAAIVAGLSRFAGRSLWIDESVYRSESQTGHRNRALGHLMRSYDIITGDVDEALEVYFRQCSILVTVRDLAVMAATLAFGGRNPTTGVQVVSPAVARDVISVMSSCGMYDFSGEWLLRVGLPAKSGVSGGLLAVAPSQFGVGVFSPRLDAHGNSVRAAAALERLSSDFEMHLLESHAGIAEPTIRIERNDGETVVRLGGELGISGIERVMTVVAELADSEKITIDGTDLARTHPAVLVVLRTQLGESDGVRIIG
ncbi:MAG TPA: glutaminase A [Microbacterium sp.]|uniref:glutaminase A n=1 Tax=Microbacterium sp. TaxID=51671 RepID=UPI002CF10159|nr:glutaminase A [Microbacterium sp.]HWI30720.1 glutaminase A [Microbacterium sp.]